MTLGENIFGTAIFGALALLLGTVGSYEKSSLMTGADFALMLIWCFVIVGLSLFGLFLEDLYKKRRENDRRIERRSRLYEQNK